MGENWVAVEKYILEAGEKLRNFDYIPQQSSLNIPLGVTKR